MLEARGVAVGVVAVDRRRPTGLSINLQRDDDRAILTARGAIPALDVAAAVAAVQRGVRHVHLASVFLVPALAEHGGALLDAARSAGATVSVDTNFDPSGAFAAPVWLRDADVLMPNAAEALALAHGGEDGSPRRRPGPRVRGRARRRQARRRGGAGRPGQRGRGGAGARRGGPRQRRGRRRLRRGAGLGAARRAPLSEALGIACACGALSLRAAGGVDGQATLDEALRLAAELRSAQ